MANKIFFHMSCGTQLNLLFTKNCSKIFSSFFPLYYFYCNHLWYIYMTTLYCNVSRLHIRLNKVIMTSQEQKISPPQVTYKRMMQQLVAGGSAGKRTLFFWKKNCVFKIEDKQLFFVSRVVLIIHLNFV